MIESKYNEWLNAPVMPNYLLDELKNMDASQKEEAFFCDLEFGTGGMRGLLGAGTNRLNIFVIQKATLGLAKYLKNKHGNEETLKVAITSDSRHFSKEFITTTAQVLATFGIETLIYSDIRPTPMLSFLVREEKCHAGIMITASHNPKEYNGYKVYDNTGAQFNLVESEKLISIINSVENTFNEEFASEFDEFITYVDEDFDEVYISAIEDVVDKTIDFDNIKIVFTPEHGTSYKIMPKALKHFGFNNVIPVVEQMTPDGDFPNTLSSNPEEIEAYTLAIKYMKERNADIVIANDPDADRLGVIVRDWQNNVVALNGNQTGTLMINYIVNKLNLVGNEVIFKTIVTGEMGAKIATDKGITVKETLTGFKFIGEQVKLIEENNTGENYIFGYEESYGSLVKPVARDKDAIQASLMLCEMVSYYKHQGLTLVDVLNGLYETVGNFSEITHSISLKGMEGLAKIKASMEFMRVNNVDTISGINVTKKIDYLNDDTGLPKSDVIKIYLENTGWVVFRPSGTEPKLKLYISVKGETLSNAEKLNNAIYNELVQKLSL